MAAASVALFAMTQYSTTPADATEASSSAPKFDNVLIGDVGGTNIRIELLKLSHDDMNTRIVLKKAIKYPTQDTKCMADAITEYLKGVAESDYPSLAVVGCAGPVVDNIVQICANFDHWS